MIRCMVVDDKPLAIDVLKNYIERVPFLTLTYSTTKPLEGLDKIIEGGIDLVFLDIQMPEITGLQFIKIIKNRCQVIFTTAYSEYALDGFENNAVDYLLKPVSFERFYKAAEKAQFILAALKEPQKESNQVVSEKEINHIFVKTEYKLVRLDTADILYIEGMQNYVNIHTVSEKVTSLQTMKKMEEQLPSSQFIRINKSFIVAINKIKSIERNRVQIGEINIAIGEIYKDELAKVITNFKN